MPSKPKSKPLEVRRGFLKGQKGSETRRHYTRHQASNNVTRSNSRSMHASRIQYNPQENAAIQEWLSAQREKERILSEAREAETKAARNRYQEAVDAELRDYTERSMVAYRIQQDPRQRKANEVMREEDPGHVDTIYSEADLNEIEDIFGNFTNSSHTFNPIPGQSLREIVNRIKEQNHQNKRTGTLKERKNNELNPRGTPLNGVNLPNSRVTLPRKELLKQIKNYSAKKKVKMGSKFVPNDLMIEMDDVFLDYEPLFKVFKEKFTNDKEVNNVLKKLKEVEDKYLNHFPEEKIEIKKFIRIKYGVYDFIIKKITIDMFTPIKEDILQAIKELRDAIYERAPVSKKNEIIDKYIKDIRSRISTDAPNIHLPLVRLRLELFYNSLEFGVPSHRTTKHVSERNQPIMVASETKEVKGNPNKIPIKDNYRYVDLFIEMEGVLFEYNKVGKRSLKFINDETDDLAYLFKLKEIRDKYLSAFPEEKEIKMDISIIYEILCKEVESRDTPFLNEIIEAKKELRDAFYARYENHKTFFTKKDEIIDSYEKDIQSRITSVDENPHILLILELYYTSLAFSYRSLRTTNNVQLRDHRRVVLETAQKKQLRIASESKGVSGRKMVLSNANKQRMALRNPF